MIQMYRLAKARGSAPQVIELFCHIVSNCRNRACGRYKNTSAHRLYDGFLDWINSATVRTDCNTLRPSLGSVNFYTVISFNESHKLK